MKIWQKLAEIEIYEYQYVSYIQKLHTCMAQTVKTSDYLENVQRTLAEIEILSIKCHVYTKATYMYGTNCQNF